MANNVSYMITDIERKLLVVSPAEMHSCPYAERARTACDLERLGNWFYRSCGLEPDQLACHVGPEVLHARKQICANYANIVSPIQGMVDIRATECKLGNDELDFWIEWGTK
jgi:hypothetical protein